MPPESPKSTRCNAREAEARWQAEWDAQGIFKTPPDALARPAAPAASCARPTTTHYVLEMFPYPSGRIHMGQEP